MHYSPSHFSSRIPTCSSVHSPIILFLPHSLTPSSRFLVSYLPHFLLLFFNLLTLPSSLCPNFSSSHSAFIQSLSLLSSSVLSTSYSACSFFTLSTNLSVSHFLFSYKLSLLHNHPPYSFCLILLLYILLFPGLITFPFRPYILFTSFPLYSSLS